MKDRFENCHKVLNELSEMVFPQSVNCECCGKEILEKDAATYYEGENFQILCSECYDKKTEEKIAELKAENDRLKEEIKNNKSAYQVELGTYNMECGNLLEENKNLIEENERLKKDKIGLHSEIRQLEQENYGLNQELLGYKKGVQASEIIELKHTLQEIKAIAERAFAVCDDDCGNANKFKEIIELTKAEEE